MGGGGGFEVDVSPVISYDTLDTTSTGGRGGKKVRGEESTGGRKNGGEERTGGKRGGRKNGLKGEVKRGLTIGVLAVVKEYNEPYSYSYSYRCNFLYLY